MLKREFFGCDVHSSFLVNLVQKKIKIGQGLQSSHKELTVMCVYGPQSVYFSAYLCFSCICFDAGF